MTDLYEVLVPVPTASRTPGEETPYTYEGDEGIPAGVRVRVSFAHREVVGVVLGRRAVAPGAGEIKRIIEVLDPEPIFPEGLFDLTKKIARLYLVPWYRALEAALPVGLKLNPCRAPRGRTIRLLRLNVPIETARARLAAEPRTSQAHKTAVEIASEHPEALTAIDLARRIGSKTTAPVRWLLAKGLLEEVERRRPRAEGDAIPVPAPPASLTPEQEAALGRICAREGFGLFLLEGVTGSGKTEVYLRSIEYFLAQNQGAILLVPEISLTPQTLARVRARLGPAVAVLHSGLSPSERYDAWRRLLTGEARVAVGPRSAVFAPIRDLGLVILDEAHDGAYKQGEAPRYDARLVAEWRARASGCPLVFGTATPTLEMAASLDRPERLFLPRRVSGTPPEVCVVDMRCEIAGGNISIFSRKLQEVLDDCLIRKKQAILFLNRLGHSPFVFCRACGRAMRCEACDLALVYHRQAGNLRCHGCEKRLPIPKTCPACGDFRIRPIGAGTERVEAEARRLFPHARILRLDSETTTRRGSHHEILSRFARGEADFLIGTQMVGKGHDLPGVSCVGIILAETALHMPDFRARERCFALLRQAIGRAGRVDLAPGEPAPVAILQTYDPMDPTIGRAAEGDTDGFLEEEIRLRSLQGLPPFRRLVVFHISGTSENAAARAARDLAERLRALVEKLPAAARALPPNGAEVVGPATSPIERLRGKSRWQVRLLLPHEVEIESLGLAALARPRPKKGRPEVEIRADVDALDLL